MNPPTPLTPDCWAISDGAAGNERQALALARALGLEPRVVRLDLRQPWAAFAPRLTRGARTAIRDSDGSPLAPPWPAIAIGCGRRAALVTRLLRGWSGGHTFTVQILDPRINTAAFDVVIAPQHDRVRGKNVLHSIGALNVVDRDWLAAGRKRFAQLAMLPAPRTAVLIGGSNHAQRLDPAYFDALLERLAARRATDGGSFLVSVSRRTPESITTALRNAFANFPGVFWDGSESENPYAGFLAWADRIIVTPDSVNMLSEAAATGKPLYTFASRPITGKLAGFHTELIASGYLRRLDDATHRPQPEPLAETNAIAELVHERWRNRDVV
ncbi:MAG: mitochondrial fission ELM1 family protein [Dokdonella sp.]